MDPISAIANAIGEIQSSLYNGISSIWTSINQKKIEKQKVLQLKELTTQERIKYDELLSAGNYQAASDLLAAKQSAVKSNNVVVWMIIGFAFLIILAAVIAKTRKK